MWTYTTSVTWTGGEAADIHGEGKPTLPITPPPEFGGRKEYWSPEDLLVAAVESCMLLTALFFVDKLKISLLAYQSRATGKLERTPNGLRFQGIDLVLTARVASAEDAEKMRTAAEKAEKYCPVSAAVNCPITLQTSVSVG